jgi:large subunit ribosomal protein L3
MAGRGGYKMRVNYSLEVLRMDYDRSLIYVKGNVPGAKGSLVMISDAFKDEKKNRGYLNYPTFVYDPEMEYASMIDAEATKEDPNEVWLHENAVVKDDKDEGGEE